MAHQPSNRNQGDSMTVDELYEALDKAGIDFEVIEIFDGLRVISIVVDENCDEEEETA